MLTPSELLEHANSRVKHPFLGSFTLSMLICNWKFILLGFAGDLSPAQRIAEIEVLLSKTDMTNLIYPLVFAINIAFIYPFANALSNLFYRFITIIEGNADSKLREKIDENSELLFVKSTYLIEDTYSKLVGLANEINNRNPNEFQVMKPLVVSRLHDALNLMNPIVQGNREQIKEAYIRLKLSHKQ